MSVAIHLHKTHRRFANNEPVVHVEGTTVGECLRNLITHYPGMETSVFDAKGGLRNTVEIYVNLESAYPDEMMKQIADGDEIYITVTLAGG